MYFLTLLCLICVKDVLAIIRGLYSIRTEGCAIVGWPEVSEGIKHIVAAPPTVRNCSSVEALVTSNASHIWVNREAFASYKVYSEDTFYCCYQYFSALNTLENIVYSDCKEFSTMIQVEHEFVHINCYYLDEVVYSDFFLFNFHRDVAPNTHHSKESYNILILGMENLSRLNFHRTMPLTSAFLKDRGVIELMGYSKVGDNTFPNLFPVLTGLSFEYVRETCISDYVYNYDKCINAFIWDKFKEKGYLTALGSDSIVGLLGSYEYSLPKIPTDFYLQPFILETRKLFKDHFHQYRICMGYKYFYRVLLEYIYGLTQHLNINRLFGMFWEESISHESLNNPHIMDKSYLNFLSDLHQDNYLSKTILILLSDHGMRWGDIVHTEQGRLERLLPLLEILFPESFKQRYKLAFENIQHNVHRLTTPYDIHETLLDLLNLDSLEDKIIRKRTNSSTMGKSSLFLPISSRRNCTSVGIAEHWCPCHRGKKIKVGSKVKTIAAQKLLEHINKMLDDYPQCHKLTLGHIYDVYLLEKDKIWKTYSVMVKTKPGGGIFEGTLVLSRSHWVISGTVSRLNLYRNQSECVPNDLVKMYCYCY